MSQGIDYKIPDAVLRMAKESNIKLNDLLTLLSDVLNIPPYFKDTHCFTHEVVVSRQYVDETQVDYYIRLFQSSRFSRDFLNDFIHLAHNYSSIISSKLYSSLLRACIDATYTSLLEEHCFNPGSLMEPVKPFRTYRPLTKNVLRKVVVYPAGLHHSVPVGIGYLEPPELFGLTNNESFLRQLFFYAGAKTVVLQSGYRDLNLFFDFRSSTSQSFDPEIYPFIGYLQSEFLFDAYTFRDTSLRLDQSRKMRFINPHNIKEPFDAHLKKYTY